MSELTDISYWNGLPYSTSPNTSGIDYALLALKSPQGIIIRASLGIQEDLRFPQNYAKLKERDVPLGAYHYLLDDINGAWQAEAFLTALSGRTFTLPLVVDCEDNSAGLSKAVLSARIKLFIDTVHSARPSDQIMIYTRASWWNDNVGNPAWAKNYPLWIARYTTWPKPWGNPGDASWVKPNSWDTYYLWQYSADENRLGAEYGVLSGAIDLNRYGPDFIPPDPDPIPDPQPSAFTLTAQVQNQSVRTGPSTTYPKVDALAEGADYAVYDVEVEGAYRVWARLSPVDQPPKWAAIVHNATVYLK